MKILITEIENKEDKHIKVNFCEIIEEFNKEKPVSAAFDVQITGEIIRIRGNIHAEVNLVCDLCLKEFTKTFNIDVDEAFEKGYQDTVQNKELELKAADFTEYLNGQDNIDLTDFVYQCVILNIPNKLVCDINCKGDEFLSRYIKKENTDPRLEIFKKIKIEKDN